MYKKSKEFTPLVSVMMPAYNAGKSIRFALASLQAQSYQHWECVVVDDGSIDNTSAVVETLNDNRIRLIRLETNLGRGAARQIALESTRGEYLAMLDSDDWIYPKKLEKQVEILMRFPEVSLVSSGMAIYDSDDNIVGIRGAGDCIPVDFINSVNVPVSHAPSMFRASSAWELKYDSRLKLAQDVDFLRRYLSGKKYLVLSDILYAYGEVESVGIKKIIMGTIYNMIGISKYFSHYPLAVITGLIKSFVKFPIVLLLVCLGGKKFLVARRSSAYTKKNHDDYAKAKKEIQQFLPVV